MEKSSGKFNGVDQAAALAISLLLVAVGALLYLGTGWLPRGAPALAGAALAAAAQRAMDYRRGVSSIEDIKRPPRSYWQWAVSAIGMGVALPAIFPADAYDTSPWLVHINAFILVLGLSALPALALNGLLIRASVRRRNARA